MSLPNYKELKKLASACRKAGIKHFKSAEMEFTLTDEIPVAPTRSKKASLLASPNTSFETDSLSTEDLLFWSSGEADAPQEQ